MSWVLLILLAWLQVPPSVPSQAAQPIALRLHHLHYRVIDPLTSMKAAADPAAPAPVILPGIGVGVRVAAGFLLFERTDAEPTGPPATITPAMYTAIVDGLTAKGLSVSVEPAPFLELSRRVPEAADHVAFATSDWLGAVAALERSGVRVSRRNDVSATFRLSARGPLVEVVRDPDEPDVYWCAMHPDVRSPAPGICPLCRMALVPIPAPRIGEYRMDVAPVRASSGRGLRGLRVGIQDPDSGALVTALATIHERPLHLFVVGRNGSFFAHVHPEPVGDGTFEVHHDIPPGEYMVAADFLPQGGTPQMAQHAIIVPGADLPAAAASFPTRPLALQAEVDGVRAALDATAITSARTSEFRFTLNRTPGQQPVTDLQPYLSAPGHLFVASEDLTFAVHGHPGADAHAGPDLSFALTLPAPGRYFAWLQVQRRGRVITLPFVVEAR